MWCACVCAHAHINQNYCGIEYSLKFFVCVCVSVSVRVEVCNCMTVYVVVMVIEIKYLTCPFTVQLLNPRIVIYVMAKVRSRHPIITSATLFVTFSFMFSQHIFITLEPLLLQCISSLEHTCLLLFNPFLNTACTK